MSERLSDGATRPKRRDGFRGREAGDEFLLYDEAADRFHVLNRTAKVIYDLCDGSRGEEALAAALTERFEVSLETAREDVRRTLETFRGLGIVD